jgi:nitrate reductase NapAB chaperone NapD
MMHEIYTRLQEKSLSKEKFGELLVEDPKLIEIAIKGLEFKPASIKFGSSKALLILSKSKPEFLYPYFDELLPYLHHENNILRYGMIFILSNLSVVDENNRISEIYDEYFGLIKQPFLIPASNVVKASKIIINTKPELADQIITDILEIDHIKYETPECKNIIIGHAIETFHETMELIKPKHEEAILAFVKKHQENSRSGTQKKAMKFLKKYNPR